MNEGADGVHNANARAGGRNPPTCASTNKGKRPPTSPYRTIKPDDEDSVSNKLRVMRETQKAAKEDERKRALRYRFGKLNYEQLKCELQSRPRGERDLKMTIALDMGLQAAIDVGVGENNERAVKLWYEQLDDIDNEDKKQQALEAFYGLTEELPSEDTMATCDRVQGMDDTPTTPVRDSCAADLPTDEKMPAKVLFQKEN